MKIRPFQPAIIFGIFIFILSSLPIEGLVRIQHLNKIFGLVFADYTLHFFAFGIFTVLLCYGFYKRDPSSIPCFKVGLISISFGLFIEGYHGILSFRTSSLKDLIPNLAGVFVFLIGGRIYLALRKS